MKTIMRGKIGGWTLAIAAWGTVLAGGVWADCGPSQNGRIQAGFPASPFAQVQYSPADRGLVDAAIPAADGPAGPAGPANNTIVGLWNITFTSGGQVVDQGFDAWHADGTETLNDNPPPSTGNVCLGVWQQMGKTFKLKHPSWTYDNNGNLTGIATIREQVTLDPGGNGFKGTFTIDFADLNNNILLHLTGTVSAKRIMVD